jgi:hypothetical protein
MQNRLNWFRVALEILSFLMTFCIVCVSAASERLYSDELINRLPTCQHGLERLMITEEGMTCRDREEL